MRTLLLASIGLLLGCSATKSGKELTPEENVFGIYEIKDEGKTWGIHILKNGICEHYFDNKKVHGSYKWFIKDDEVNLETPTFDTTPEGEKPKTNPKDAGTILMVMKIELSRDLTLVAIIDEGKRYDLSEEKKTIKKIK